MGGKPYENLALLYYFCSFTHSKTSPRNCGLHIFRLGALQPATAERTAPNLKTRFCFRHNGINLKALGEKDKSISGFTSVIQLFIQ